MLEWKRTCCLWRLGRSQYNKKRICNWLRLAYSNIPCSYSAPCIISFVPSTFVDGGPNCSKCLGWGSCCMNVRFHRIFIGQSMMFWNVYKFAGHLCHLWTCNLICPGRLKLFILALSLALGFCHPEIEGSHGKSIYGNCLWRAPTAAPRVSEWNLCDPFWIIFFCLRVFFLCGALMKSYVWFSRQEVSLSLLCDSKVQEGFPQDLLPQSQGLDSLWNWWYAARKWTWHSRLVTVNLESLNANDIRYIEWYLMSIQNSYNVYIYIIYVFL